MNFFQDDYLSSITEVNYYINSGETCDYSTWNSFESSLNQPSSVLSKFPQPENDSRDENYSLEPTVCEAQHLVHSIGRQTNTISEVSKQKGMIRTVADIVRRRDITLLEHIPSEI